VTPGAVFAVALAALLLGWFGGMFTIIAGEPWLSRLIAFLIRRKVAQ
jgi:hypothetical protein